MQQWAIDHQMAMIQVQVGKNFIYDVLIEGGFGITSSLRIKEYN
jgi:hypothetical protein